jgi:acetylornithine/N-succinyldiaminopimelate aminotransferase
MATLMNTYGARKLTLVKGEGSRVWDDQGNSYLDAISGIAVCSLGHAHPSIARAIAEQASSLMHVSNLYNIPQQEQLANILVERSGLDSVFFSNSGAEANEGALKIARKHGNDKGLNNPKVIVMQQGFHGRTLATLSATGNPKVHAGFEPLVEGFVRVPFDDVEAIKTAAAEHDNIVAILVEPVQGEGGVHVPADDYLNKLRAICDQNEWLLMLDEIQTGIGRTGAFFAYQHNGILPDVVTSAKGLGNGATIGAVLTRGAASTVLQPGNHGTTFGGNPLSCSAALAVMSEMNDELIANVSILGDTLIEGFKAALESCDSVVEIRGKGLMIGIELNRPCAELVDSAREAGVLINVAAGNTVRLLPTFILTDDEVSELVTKVSAVIKNF